MSLKFQKMKRIGVLLLKFRGHAPTRDLLRAAMHMFPQMVLGEKTGLVFLGRITKRDRIIRDNVDGLRPILVCPTVHEAQWMEEICDWLSCVNHSRDILANKWNP
eukprot:9479753-Pyramimonas_sp.AAC.1